MKRLVNVPLPGDPWGFSIHPTGRYIAWRKAGNDWNKESPNVFVYRSDGVLINSFYSAHGTEWGVAFWPDSNHILVPGCGQAPRYDDDGLKVFPVGNPENFYVALRSTPLTDINVELFGVTDNGRYIIGSAGGHGMPKLNYSIDTHVGNKAVRVSEDARLFMGYSYSFSANERYTGVGGPWTTPIGLIVDNQTGELVWTGTKQPVLCFAPDNNYAVIQDGLRGFQLVEMETWKPLETYSFLDYGGQHTSGMAATISPDGNYLAVSCPSALEIFIFDTSDFHFVERIPFLARNSSSIIRAMGFSHFEELVMIETVNYPTNDAESYLTVWG